MFSYVGISYMKRDLKYKKYLHNYTVMENVNIWDI